MNEQILTSLSIITSFHDKNKSVVDSLLPLVEYGIALLCNETGNNHFDTDSLKSKILNSSGIQINTITLKSLLKKLHKKGNIELLEQGSFFKVIHSFKKEQDAYLAAIRDNHRSTHKFVFEYKKHSQDNRDEAEIIPWIYDFICEYCKFIDVNNNNISVQFESEKYKNFLAFLSYINECESELTNTFRSIYLGANICFLLENTGKIIDKKQFNSLVVYLDSNFILRLMDFQEEQFSNETNELFTILTNNNIKLKIFSETIEEVKSVLGYYLSVYKKEKEQYAAILSQPNYINGVLGAFYRKNCTFTQIEDVIDNVEKFIKEHRISIDNIERYKRFANETEIAKLYDAKYTLTETEQSQKYRYQKCKHYIQIIEVINYLRKCSDCPSSCLGNSKYVFLTCDLKLYKFCRNNTQHAYKFPSIVSQEILANDLLLFNPQDFSGVSFQLLIALYKNSDYIDIHALDRLKDTINTIAKENPTDAELVIKATRNCEDYSILNNLLEDDVDDKQQLLTLAGEIKKKEEKMHQTLTQNEETISKNNKDAQYANDRISLLEAKVDETEKKIKMVVSDIEKERESYFIEDMAKYVKYIKCISVLFCVLFAVVVVAITLITGFQSWFSLPFSSNWWIWLLSAIFLIGLVVTAIYNGKENRWLIQCVNRKESILMKKYHLQDFQIERLQAHYWGKTNL